MLQCLLWFQPFGVLGVFTCLNLFFGGELGQVSLLGHWTIGKRMVSIVSKDETAKISMILHGL